MSPVHAAAFSVPKRDPHMLMSDAAKASMPDDFTAQVAQWVERVNERAGRKIVGAVGTAVVVATSGQRIKPGKIIVIIDGALANQPATFRIVDRMEFLA